MTSMSFSLFPNQIKPPLSSLKPNHYHLNHHHHHHHRHLFTSLQFHTIPFQFNGFPSKLSCLCYSETSIPTLTTTTSSSLSDIDNEVQQLEEEEATSLKSSSSSSSGGVSLAPPLLKKRKRYRKEYPGESDGITQEMRFVAMKLRNHKGSSFSSSSSNKKLSAIQDDNDKIDGVWEPTIQGFLKYLVDSKLVFHTIEALVEDSNDVSYAYFRRTGLERSGSLARDLEWFSQKGMTIPEPSNPGVSYASYLKELADKSAPLFLSHFYNVYFAHLAGGQVIAKQVAAKLVQERQLEFFNWEGDEEEFLKEVREKLNKLGEHWSRDDKNKSLKEVTKSFRYLGQIVRLIILL